MADYNSSYTGEQIDTAVGKALSPDSTPTQNSTNLVQSGGVFAALNNRNLLDNPFFTVNQRGSASYTSAGYTVDRWKLITSNTTAQSVTVNTNGVTLSGTASGSNSCLLRQTIENASQYAGKTVTVSVSVGLVAGSSVYLYLGTNANERFAYISFPFNNHLYSKTVTLPNDITSLFVQIGQNENYYGTGPTSIEIRAVKLELGSVSTLANDVPQDYGEELTRCIYSTADPSDTYANTGFGLARSNRNLLDNAYFVGGGSQQGGGQFPINQRGNTSYSGGGGGYLFDRWKRINSIACSLQSDCLQITNTNWGLRQVVGMPPGTYTFSMLARKLTYPSGGSMGFNSYNNIGSDWEILGNDWGLYEETFTTQNDLGNANLQFNSNLGSYSIEILAMKLELGSTQTLAHKENGVWVLNEIPNYGEQLERCITSKADSGDTYANKVLATDSDLLSKANTISGTTSASSVTLDAPNGRFYIILATRGDTSVTFAMVSRYNSSYVTTGTNTAGVTVNASTGEVTFLSYTIYRIIY